MRTRAMSIAALAAAVLAGVLIGTWSGEPVDAQEVPGAGFAAIPGQKGGQDIYGPYEPVVNWPQPMSASLPNHENFTYGQSMDVFAESPNRVFFLQRGEMVNFPDRPQSRPVFEIGPGLVFPVARAPIRQAGAASCNNPRDKVERQGAPRPGIDCRYEHVILVANEQGRIVEDWTQWDKLFSRAHDVEISPYDPQKAVWVVDAEGHAVYKFSNDGKKLLLTLGTPTVPGDDDTHLRRPTFLVFMDANTMYLADGYDNQRVIKYDMNGKKLLQWGQEGEHGVGQNGTGRIETRPGYFYNVHGIAVDPVRREVFVHDRNNGRVQVFDENGNYRREWSFGPRPPMDVHSFIITSDRKLWAADQGTHKILGYDLDGHFLYSWGSMGEYPGGQWGVHGMSTDQQGNLYVAEVNNGRVQKYRPRAGANPAFMVGKPWKGVW